MTQAGDGVEGDGVVVGGSDESGPIERELGETVSSVSHAEVAGEAAALAPRISGRIEGLDVARGFALLGIFLVNIEFMAYPLGILETRPKEDVVDLGVWAFVRIFCEGKFYPLFSMLFGMGLMLQRQRVVARGRPFVPLYLRRLVHSERSGARARTADLVRRHSLRLLVCWPRPAAVLRFERSRSADHWRRPLGPRNPHRGFPGTPDSLGYA